MKWILTYLAVLASILVADIIWLGTTMTPLYRPEMGALIAPQVNGIGVIGFYLTYALGVVALVIAPFSKTNTSANLWPLRAQAAILGLVSFGTYDFTGLAIINKWPLKLSFIDIGWGIVTTIIAAHWGWWVWQRLASVPKKP